MVIIYLTRDGRWRAEVVERGGRWPRRHERPRVVFPFTLTRLERRQPAEGVALPLFHQVVAFVISEDRVSHCTEYLLFPDQERHELGCQQVKDDDREECQNDLVGCAERVTPADAAARQKKPRRVLLVEQT